MSGLSLNQHQLVDLDSLRRSESYAEAYAYMRDIVIEAQAETKNPDQYVELGNLANWLDRAASINSDDGSFSSEFVRGATSGINERLGRGPVDDESFQRASNYLADLVISDVVDHFRIPSSSEIIKSDVAAAVANVDSGGLGLPDWGWAGTWGDWLPSPIGLGGNYVSIGGEPVFDYARNWAISLAAQWDGLDRWTQRRFGELFDGLQLEDLPWLGIDEAISRSYVNARVWRPNIDPLMLDLDGDGLELTAASRNVLFDFDADGVKTATGWIRSDDGILVRDLNGNGTIDTGRELFGVDTIKRDGQHATNGFDALADLDSNADGSFTSADAAWSSVKVWRDLDQDGLSEANELFGLEALGIRRIGTTGSTTNATGGTQANTRVNDNLIAQSASYTRVVDGAETRGTVGAVDLAANNFVREYTTPIAISAEARRSHPWRRGQRPAQRRCGQRHPHGRHR